VIEEIRVILNKTIENAKSTSKRDLSSTDLNSLHSKNVDSFEAIQIPYSARRLDQYLRQADHQEEVDWPIQISRQNKGQEWRQSQTSLTRRNCLIAARDPSPLTQNSTNGTFFVKLK